MNNLVQKSMVACQACGKQDSYLFVKKNEYRINRCCFCKSLFVSNPPYDVNSIYSKEYFWGATKGFGYVDYDTDKDPMKIVFKKCLSKLENLVKEKTLLDVGTATGYFLNLAKERGWHVTGVEIGNEAAEQGRKSGLKIITGTVMDVPSDAKYDVVTMFDVIEHIPNSRDSLTRVWNLLKPNGILLIVTPNSSSIYARLLGKRWHLIVPPEHLVLFNTKSLSDLLKKIDFDILEIKSPGKSFTLPYIFHTLFCWQKFKIWGWLLGLVKDYRLTSNLRLPIDLGDNMMIYARKTHCNFENNLSTNSK